MYVYKKKDEKHNDMAIFHRSMYKFNAATTTSINPSQIPFILLPKLVMANDEKAFQGRTGPFERNYFSQIMNILELKTS